MPFVLLPLAWGARADEQGENARAAIVIGADLHPESTSAQPGQGDRQGGASGSASTRMIISMKTGDTHLAVPEPGDTGKLGRWLEMQTASLSSRYHFVENSAGTTTANQAQHQATFRGRLRFDPHGDYSLHAGVFPGNRFSGGWNSTGAGTGDFRSNLYLKQLYFSASPLRGLELQAGGLYFDQGESTEMTGYDFDGYLTGYRMTLTRPKDIFFNEVSITFAYLGDFASSSVTKRFRRLQQSNYHQVLVSKMLGGRAALSGDYTFESGVDTLRQAIKVRMPELRLVDVIHFENYEVWSPDPGYGFGAYGEKKIGTKLSLGGGYAQHDRPGLYSDRFAEGKRVFLNLHLAIDSAFSISTAVTQAISNREDAAPRTRVDVAFGYNLLGHLRRTRLF
jgi:hypothetical protein